MKPKQAEELQWSRLSAVVEYSGFYSHSEDKNKQPGKKKQKTYSHSGKALDECCFFNDSFMHLQPVRDRGEAWRDREYTYTES